LIPFTYPLRIVHALLIGIDRYESPDIVQLGCAVADMDLVKSFLTFDLNVSESCITTLVNEGATREAIISALKQMAIDDDLLHGEAVLIYFAGHGTTISSKQALVPYDAPFQRVGIENLISDVKLASLLHKLANAKGDNIVRITQYSLLL